TSNDLKWIDDQGKANFPFTIKGPDNQDVYYKYSGAQTLGSAEPVDTGEYKNIFEKIDITTMYSIIKPGKYTIQFREGNYGINNESIPASNILEFNVKDGTPDKYDVLIKKLKDIIPDKRWRLSPGEYQGSPLGRKPAKGVSLVYSRHPDSGLKGDVVSIQLWQTESESDIAESDNKSDGKISDYIGRDTGGQHYYIYVSEKAKEFWPSAKKDIISSLNLKS
ncbi:MAG: hypothetical protein KC618_08560, partial [Candidatus Omnitrophica bacterium]|nr:hypothetical protein [Candidatus Omnitrophota bacterium]